MQGVTMHEDDIFYIPPDPRDEDGEVRPVVASPLAQAMQRAREAIGARVTRTADEIPLGGYNAAELLDMDIPDVEWAIHNVLPKDSVGLIGAEYKGCKTWLGGHVAVTVGTGGNLLGNPKWRVERKAHVLYIAWEDGKKNMRSRLRAIATGQRLNAKEALQNIHIIPRPPRLNIAQPRGQEWVVAHAQALPAQPALIVLDPLGNIHQAKNENDAAEMGPVWAGLQVIRDTLPGTSIYVAHHMGKPRTDGGKKMRGRLADRLRGSSLIFQSADAWLLLDHKREEQTDRHRQWGVTLEVGSREGGGGTISAELDVQLKENGTARTAAWVISEERPRNADEENEVMLLEHMREGGWYSAESLADATDVSKSTVNRTLQRLEKKGRAERIGSGPNTTWRVL